ncbi:hypothetical protein [Streptomyces sp. WMMC897]|uniref:hypothetical protein n=1 Tax=Streptomyces sp. WMMC897 TaxID=3014782 RepID=UPI0022B7525C|nr:hypothetical protein [Streptomyces sp. WMMC897]MCZ7416784.1 hypothetical protein [Streptomyces sp. WMMC897]
MTIRHAMQRRLRLSATAVMGVGLAAVLTACGGGGDDDTAMEGKNENSASSERKNEQTPAESVDTEKVIGKLAGTDDILIELHSASRDAGGFVTVHGTLTNTGDKTFSYNRWSSTENSLRSKSSISGATLVDPVGKKRYMILRDTDGECLCTTGLTNIKSGETRPVYAQFPAPPAVVTKVEFHLPTMTPAIIELTEG